MLRNGSRDAERWPTSRRDCGSIWIAALWINAAISCPDQRPQRQQRRKSRGPIARQCRNGPPIQIARVAKGCVGPSIAFMPGLAAIPRRSRELDTPDLNADLYQILTKAALFLLCRLTHSAPPTLVPASPEFSAGTRAGAAVPRARSARSEAIQSKP